MALFSKYDYWKSMTIPTYDYFLTKFKKYDKKVWLLIMTILLSMTIQKKLSE